MTLPRPKKYETKPLKSATVKPIIAVFLCAMFNLVSCKPAANSGGLKSTKSAQSNQSSKGKVTLDAYLENPKEGYLSFARRSREAQAASGSAAHFRVDEWRPHLDEMISSLEHEIQFAKNNKAKVSLYNGIDPAHLKEAESCLDDLKNFAETSKSGLFYDEFLHKIPRYSNALSPMSIQTGKISPETIAATNKKIMSSMEYQLNQLMNHAPLSFLVPFSSSRKSPQDPKESMTLDEFSRTRAALVNPFEIPLKSQSKVIDYALLPPPDFVNHDFSHASGVLETEPDFALAMDELANNKKLSPAQFEEKVGQFIDTRIKIIENLKTAASKFKDPELATEFVFFLLHENSKYGTQPFKLSTKELQRYLSNTEIRDEIMLRFSKFRAKNALSIALENSKNTPENIARLAAQGNTAMRADNEAALILEKSKGTFQEIGESLIQFLKEVR